MHAGGQFAGVEGVQPPEAGRLVERTGAVAIEHSRRQDADHLVRLVVEQQVAAEDGGVAAEVALPGGVAQHHHARRAGLVFFGAERAAKERLDAEHGEVIGRHVAAVEAHRLTVHRDGRGGERLGGQGLERPVLPLQLDEVAGRGRVAGGGGRRLPDAHDPLRVREWQRLEQHAVDQAEHRRVGTDAERQHPDGDQGEARIAGE